MIIISIIYVILLCLILKAYYRDVSDIDKRILELEKNCRCDKKSRSK